MFQLTPKQLSLIMPHLAITRRDALLPYLNAAMSEFSIAESRPGMAAFLANLAEESCELRWFEEIASGAAYDTGKKARDLGNTPEADGDGQKYKGHGPMQITGRRNHERCGKALNLDLINNPRLLTLPQYGFRSAGWFWCDRKLNSLADVLTGEWNFAEEKAFKAIVKAINGGYNGLPRRIQYYRRALMVIGNTRPLPPKPSVPIVASTVPATTLTPPKPATPTLQATAEVDAAIAASPKPSKLMLLLQSSWGRVSTHGLRFFGWIAASLEAGDKTTYLGLAVFVIVGAVLIYYYRKDLKIWSHKGWLLVKDYLDGD